MKITETHPNARILFIRRRKLLKKVDRSKITDLLKTQTTKATTMNFLTGTTSSNNHLTHGERVKTITS